MECCEKCGQWTDFYHVLPSGAIVCEDCKGEYIMEDELLEWPCQDLHGGTGTAIYSNVDGMCKHPECHPKNDQRISYNEDREDR